MSDNTQDQISTYDGDKYARCRIAELNGVPGFNLYINNRDYGHYPISENHNSIDQIKCAISDAQDYNYKGIYFQ